MILNIITFIFSILGIIGFYNNSTTLLFLGMVIVLLEIIIEFLSGQLKTLTTCILAIIIGIICTKDILVGTAIGLCFESVIMSFSGWLLLGLSYLISNHKK